MFDSGTNDKREEEYGNYDNKPKPDPYGELQVKPILDTIAQSKPMLKKQLLKKLEKIRQRCEHIFFTQKTLERLIFQGYVQEVDGRCHLTHIGFLEFLFYFYVKHSMIIEHVEGGLPYYNVDDSQKPEVKKFKDEFEEIRKKYKHLLPEIFDDDDFKKLGIDPYVIVVLLLKLYKNWKEVEVEPMFGLGNQYGEEF